MKTTLNSPKDTDAILKYIAKDLSWRKLYFSKFTIQQKIRFFLPVFFILSPIYGMYLLFHTNSWYGFLIFAILGLVSIWAFVKQKMVFEKKVFEKYYQSNTCKSMLDFELENFSLFLGEHNTFENRKIWLDYFKKKQPNASLSIITSVVVVVCCQFASHQGLNYIFGFFSCMFLLIIFVFIKPAITDFKFRAEAINGALKLIGELDYRAV